METLVTLNESGRIHRTIGRRTTITKAKVEPQEDVLYFICKVRMGDIPSNKYFRFQCETLIHPPNGDRFWHSGFLGCFEKLRIGSH